MQKHSAYRPGTQPYTVTVDAFLLMKMHQTLDKFLVFQAKLVDPSFKGLHLEHPQPLATSQYDINEQMYYPLCKAMHATSGSPLDANYTKISYMKIIEIL